MLAAQTRAAARPIIWGMLEHIDAARRRRRRAQPLHGRADERDALVEALSRTAAGSPADLLVEGPSGSGRTRLLEEAAIVAERLGLPLLGGAGLAREPGGAARVKAALARRSGRPLAIVVDDLDALPEAGVRALAATVEEVAAEALPVSWLLALRPARLGPPGRALARALEERGARRVALAPLGADAVAALLAERAGGRPGPRLAALARRAEGDPGLLVALLDGLAREQRLRADGRAVELDGDALPAALVACARGRLDELGVEAAQVVRVAAALGPTCRAVEIGAMLDRSPARLLAPIEEALAADLLAESGARLAFRQPLVREALLGALPASVRRGLRRQAAEVLLAGGARGADVAEQLLDGVEPGDAAVARRVLEAAAELAPADAERAAELALRAVEVVPSTASDRPRAVAQAIALLRAADRHLEAEQLGVAALELPLAADEEAELRLLLSTLDELPGAVARAEHNRRALRDCALDPRLRARHLAWLAHNLLAAGERERARATVERARRAAAAGDDVQARAVAALAEARGALRDGDPVTALDALAGLPRLRGSAAELSCARRLELTRAAALAAVGRLEEATALARDGLAAAERGRRRWLIGRWRALHGLLDLMAGRLDAAERQAEALAAGGPGGRLVLLELARRRGDLAAIHELREAARGDEPSGAEERRWLLALAESALRRGLDAADAADAALATAPLDPWWHVDVARTAVAADVPELGRRVVAATARWSGETAPPALAAIAHHVRGVVAGDRAALARAVERARAGGRPLVLAAALVDHGAALAHADLRADGIQQLQEGRALHADAGAAGDARRAAELLGALGVATAPSGRREERGWSALTLAELRVVRLVAEGATNREAAARLHLSPHTVSSHLRKAFAKLEINSRVELARVVVRHDDRL